VVRGRLKIPAENQIPAENLTPIATRTVALARNKRESENKGRGVRTGDLKAIKIDAPMTTESPIAKIKTARARAAEIKVEAVKAAENAEEMSLPR